MNEPRPLFSVTLPVWVSHINYGQHLAHDALISLLHEARVRWLSSLSLSELDLGEGAACMIKKLSVDYLSEAFYGDKLEISLALIALTRCSFEIYYKVVCLDSGREVATGTTHMVCCRALDRRITAVPSRLKVAFSA